MEGAQHYAKAQSYLLDAIGMKQMGDRESAALEVAQAQTHALLALCAATVEPILKSDAFTESWTRSEAERIKSWQRVVK